MPQPRENTGWIDHLRAHAGHHLPFFARYATIGLGNSMVDIGVFALGVYHFGWTPVESNTVSYVVVVVLSFLANKIWTFRDTRRGREAWNAFGRFVLVNVFGLGLSNLVVWLAVTVMMPLLAKLIAIAVVVLYTYLAYRYWVYRPRDSEAV